MDLKARAKKLKTDIPAIFLSLKDKDSPLLAKIFAGITVVQITLKRNASSATAERLFHF